MHCGKPILEDVRGDTGEPWMSGCPLRCLGDVRRDVWMSGCPPGMPAWKSGCLLIQFVAQWSCLSGCRDVLRMLPCILERAFATSVSAAFFGLLSAAEPWCLSSPFPRTCLAQTLSLSSFLGTRWWFAKTHICLCFSLFLLRMASQLDRAFVRKQALPWQRWSPMRMSA